MAKDLIKRGEREGTTIITESQIARGRRGRKWYCPSGSSILGSIILKPKLKPTQLLQIPLMAGVAVVRAIRKTTSLKAELKWVNDILVSGKKVGGVLAETFSSLSYVILGIGINVNRPQGYLFPEGLEEKAAFLSDFGGIISRTDLLCFLLEELEGVYQLFLERGFEPIRKQWKEFNLTLGRMVKIMDSGEVGWAEDIDKEGALILRLKDGSQKRIISDEIFLRTPSGEYI